MMPRGLLAQPDWEEGREAPGRALGASLGAQGNLALQRGAGTGLLGVIPSSYDWGCAQTSDSKGQLNRDTRQSHLQHRARPWWGPARPPNEHSRDS